MGPIPFDLIGGIFQSILGNKARNQELALQQRALNESQRSAREGERMAKATRTDVYGNSTGYEEGKGFVSKASPIIQAILNAQTREELKAVTEDAPRAREASLRKDKRSRDAGGLYDRAFSEVSNRYRKPESEYTAEGVLGAVEDRNDLGNPVSQALVAQALRSGDTASLSRIAKATAGQGGIGKAIRTGRDVGANRYVTEKGNRDSVEYGELDRLRAVADGVDSPNVSRNNTGENLSNQQEGMMQALMRTISAGGSSVSGALSSAARTSGQAPDYSAIFKSLNDNYGTGKGRSDPELEALLREFEMSKAELGTAQNRSQLSVFRGNQGRF